MIHFTKCGTEDLKNDFSHNRYSICLDTNWSDGLYCPTRGNGEKSSVDLRAGMYAYYDDSEEGLTNRKPAPIRAATLQAAAGKNGALDCRLSDISLFPVRGRFPFISQA